MLEEVEDPSDWPKEFLGLKIIDSLLRCSICYDYFNIAVIVPHCSHTYCSICIRKHLTYKNNCPSCDMPMLDSDLKSNRILDELVKSFKIIRANLLDVLQSHLARKKYSNSEKEESQEFVFEETPRYGHSHLSQSKQSNYSNQTLSTTSKTVQPDSNQVQDSIHQNTSEHNQTEQRITNEAVKEKVTCPVCSKKVDLDVINLHLDGCLNQQERAKRTRQTTAAPDPLPRTKRRKINTDKPGPSNWNKSNDRSELSNALANHPGEQLDYSSSEEFTDNDKTLTEESSQRSITRIAANQLIDASFTAKMKPMPSTCLNVLNEKRLREKAKLYGLPTHGDKQKLIKRLEEYTIAYNAQCDSSKPLDAFSIAKEIEKNEKIQQKHGYKPKHVVATHDNRHSMKAKKEFNERHSVKYDHHYQDLISEIRSRSSKDAINHETAKSFAMESKSNENPHIVKSLSEINEVHKKQLPNENINPGAVNIEDIDGDDFSDKGDPDFDLGKELLENPILQNDKLDNCQTTKSTKQKKVPNDKKPKGKQKVTKKPVPSKRISSFFKSSLTEDRNLKNRNVKEEDECVIIDDVVLENNILSNKENIVKPIFNSTVIPTSTSRLNTLSSMNELSPVLNQTTKPLRHSPKLTKRNRLFPDKLDVSQNFIKVLSDSDETLPEETAIFLSKPLSLKIIDNEAKNSETDTESEDEEVSHISGLTDVISNLVEDAIENPKSPILSDDSLPSPSLLDTSIIPNAPSQFTFSQTQS